MRVALALTILLCLNWVASSAHAADGGSLKLELPSDANVTSAVAVSPGMKDESSGHVDKTTIVFEKLLLDTPYDVRLTLADGSIVQGVDMTWYNEEEAKADAGPLSEEDRKEMLGIISIPDFYNKHDIIHLVGTHDRAIALVQLVRDKDFYAGTGQVIWRVELYYFKDRHGGWEKIAQQNKIVRRERFKTHDEFVAATSKLHFLAALGGLRLEKNQQVKTVKIDSLVAK